MYIWNHIKKETGRRKNYYLHSALIHKLWFGISILSTYQNRFHTDAMMMKWMNEWITVINLSAQLIAFHALNCYLIETSSMYKENKLKICWTKRWGIPSDATNIISEIKTTVNKHLSTNYCASNHYSYVYNCISSGW